MLNIKLEANNIILIEAEKKGLEILKSTFEVVLQSILGGFHARIGADRKEVQKFLLIIEENLKNYQTQQDNNLVVKLPISVEYLRILTQVLNETCHGIRILDFEHKIGTSKDYLKLCLEQSYNLYINLEK
ncbi:MAG: hypothetical protein ACM65L_06665 [Microcoleus sp.]